MRDRMRLKKGKNRKGRLNRNCSSSRPVISAIFTALAGLVIKDLQKENGLIKSVLKKKLQSPSQKETPPIINDASFEVLENNTEKKEEK